MLMNGCGKTGSDKENKVLLPVKEDQTISFRIWFNAGSQNDPKGKEGLSALTASMLTEGSTMTNSYEQILEKLYPMAANYQDKVDKEMTVIMGRTHIDNLKDYYELLKDAILKPAFKQEDFDRLKSQMLNYLENDLRYSSDEELGKAAVNNFIFEGTPYGHIPAGTVSGLKSITLDDVKTFYKKNYTKDNFGIGLGGNYPDELVATIEKDLSALTAKKVDSVAKPVPAKIEGMQVNLINKECDATAISFGFPIDVLRGDKDFFALYLFNSWFGEHRNQSSHLYQVIREKRGMNYGDYSYIEPFLNGGGLTFPQPNNPRRQQIFEVWIRPVQNQNRNFALRAAMRELKNVVDKGITKEDFELTKNFLYNYCLFYAQTTMMRLGYQIDSKFYNVADNGNYIEYFRNKIKALTLEEVNAAIKKHLQYNNIKMSIVTRDADKFKDELVNNVPGNITYITPPPQAVLDEDKEIMVFPLNIKAENVKVINVEELFK